MKKPNVHLVMCFMVTVLCVFAPMLSSASVPLQLHTAPLYTYTFPAANAVSMGVVSIPQGVLQTGSGEPISTYSTPLLFKPDLLVTTVSVSIADPEALTYQITIKNEGRVNISTTFHTYIYLSKDESIGDAGDIKIDDWVIQYGPYTPPFVPGTTKDSGERTVDVSNKAPGTYYVGVFTDAEADIDEDDETNNTGHDSFPLIEIGTPDLLSTGIDITDIALNSHCIKTGFIFMNKGDIPIDYSWDGLRIGGYLSTDQHIDKNSDYFFDEVYDYASLDPEQTRILAGDYGEFYTNDLNVPPGEYWFGIYLDYTEDYLEKNESNNWAVDQNTKVTIPAALPDLISDGASSVAYAMDQVDLSYYAVKNYGWNDITQEFSNKFYLSEDMQIDGSDYLLKKYVHSSGLHEMGRIVLCGSTPSTLQVPAGSYYLIIQADDGQDITELSEANNVFVTQDPAQIVHLDMTHPNGGEVWKKGMTHTARWNTRGTVSRVSLELYKGDACLGSWADYIPNTGSCDMYIPASLADGSDYRVHVIECHPPCRTHDYSDAYFTIQTTSPPLTGPDLIVTAVEVVDGQGPDIEFNAVIRNRGDGPAGSCSSAFYLSADEIIDDSDYYFFSIVHATGVPAATDCPTGNVAIEVSGVPEGEYFLGLIADAQQQVSESNEGNNTGHAGSPKVTIPESQRPHWADIDGDGDVDAVDIQLVAACWNTQAGDAGYSAACDVDNDGDVDAVDIQLVAGWWNRI